MLHMFVLSLGLMHVFMSYSLRYDTLKACRMPSGILCGARKREWAQLAYNVAQYKLDGIVDCVISENASCILIMMVMHSHHGGHDVVVAGLMVRHVVFLILLPHVR